jgi:hypothetical protein
MVPVSGQKKDLLHAEWQSIGLPDLDMKNVSSCWSRKKKTTLSPNSHLGLCDYFLRCVILLDLLKGELGEAVRHL